MLNPECPSGQRREHDQRESSSAPFPQPTRASYPSVSEVRVCSLYFPTAEAAVNAGFSRDPGPDRDANTLLEVPAEQYVDAVRRLTLPVDGLGAEPPSPTLGEMLRLRQGTVSYQQALRIAQAESVEGVTIAPETEAILCNFPYGMSFALEYARARWSGGTERVAVATALGASIKAGPSSAIHGLLSARL
ncbi:MAG: hypothetical protein WBM40_21140, partial [Thiohalocapsa sp.]